MTLREQAVLTPLVFYDLFDRPVRPDVLHTLTYRRTLARSAFDQTIDRLEARGVVWQRRGFLQLAGRPGLAEIGYVREMYSKALWADAEYLIEELASIPFVRMIAVINSLAFWNANSDSDIDLLVVTEPNWIAVARDHINLWLTLWGKRNTHGPKRGKVAPDIFLDTSALAVNDFHLKPRDIYFDFWFARITPVINRHATYERLLTANPWIQTTFPQFRPRLHHVIAPNSEHEQTRDRWERFYCSSIGERVAAGLSSYQRARLDRYAHRVGSDSLVLVTPHQLRFHVPDRRLEYQQAFEARWRTLTHSSF
ncbi:hypothetical protein HY524_00270 [Candidatus Berkelbacteria bacterium]|nr:hypothetical protein [Candidatus Berkelbacteria bacterium]